MVDKEEIKNEKSAIENLANDQEMEGTMEGTNDAKMASQ